MSFWKQPPLSATGSRPYRRAASPRSASLAAMTVADHVGREILRVRGRSGDPIAAFVAEMNELGKAIRLGKTRFANPHGLELPRQTGTSTAADVAKLSIYAMRKPGFTFIVRQKDRQVTVHGAGGQRGFRAQRIEGGFGRLQFSVEIVVIQPEVEAQADALATAHQLDAGQHETAGAKPLPAGLGRIKRQSAIVAGAVILRWGDVIADPADIFRTCPLVNGAQCNIFGALQATSMPIDAGIKRLCGEPAQKGVNVHGHT